ncbi:hepatocyte growth factor receptor-like [Dysidea avara]|uniref:hepatocyte growth factor receptor-like n=1 Tax=Dysidea avara TaxID=196820 RepID=UPI00331B55BE
MQPSGVSGDNWNFTKFMNGGSTSDHIISSKDANVLKMECGDFSSLLLPRQELEFSGIIGEGEFGRVFKGVWIHKHDDGSYKSEEVAIKTVKDCESMDKLKSILHESVLMKSLHHDNILKILGVCLETDIQGGTVYIVLPYMVNGDLKTYLKNKRQSIIKRISQSFIHHEARIPQLTAMCYQIACGMNYLAEQRIVHRDLAARNCMVDEALTIKVADFGLARDVYILDYYRVQSNNKLPVKWMAPEALHDQISNEKTDVWSYGITCWEVFSLGRVPYPTISNHDILDYIDAGNRPIRPKLCPDNMYALMQKCWEADVDHRICFKEIVTELSDDDIIVGGLSDSTNDNYIHF